MVRGWLGHEIAGRSCLEVRRCQNQASCGRDEEEKTRLNSAIKISGDERREMKRGTLVTCDAMTCTFKRKIVPKRFVLL